MELKFTRFKTTSLFYSSGIHTIKIPKPEILLLINSEGSFLYDIKNKFVNEIYTLYEIECFTSKLLGVKNCGYFKLMKNGNAEFKIASEANLLKLKI